MDTSFKMYLTLRGFLFNKSLIIKVLKIYNFLQNL